MHLGGLLLRQFTLSSAWDLVRMKEVKTIIAKSCWHKHVELKISLFLWKLSHYAIPTDLAVSKKGIYLPSKCHCCTRSPQSEFNNHLFLTSETAHAVWSYFANMLNINCEVLTVRH